MDQHADIVAENLAEQFVDLRRVALAPQVIPELSLNHGEGGFGVATLVVVRQEVVAVQVVIVVYLLPARADAARPSRVTREGDVGSRVDGIEHVLMPVA